MKKRILACLLAAALLALLLPPAAAADFEISVAGVQVTSKNAADILGDGVFSYDPLNNVLTVKGDFTFEEDGALIDVGVPNQTIYVAQDVTLSAYENAISTNRDLTITGPGTLNLESFEGPCIFVYGGACLTLENCRLNADGAFGILGFLDEESLYIADSRLYVFGPYGAICGFEGGVTLENCFVTRPEGGWVDESAVVDEFGEIAPEVLIEEPGDSGPVNPFKDVYETDEYYFAVIWAYYAEPQVTSGTDKTHFSPNAPVTRAQAVTFLWRAMGEPEPTTKRNPFADVSKTAYYYKAVLWAVENGITGGTDKTHFSPDQTCSTAHIITFLYRTMGVGEDGWYKEAGAWAKQTGLLDGLNLKVSPDVNCPRAYVVLLLHRQLAEL